VKPTRSRAGLFAAAAVAVLAVGAGGLVWKMRQGVGDVGGVDVPVAASTVRVDALAGAGLVLVSPQGERALTVGESIEGSFLRTDARTRARLVMGDGSIVTVQQNSELSFAAGRTVQLARGEALFDVAHQPSGPRFEVNSPMGRVEVLGTKFLVTVDGAQGSVRVLRGEVRVSPSAGAAASLKAGQEALVRADGAHVVNAVDLAGSVAWSELGGDAEDDLPIPGLGELRAHRPGERQEQERPLTLADHRVTVRIVGNVARTEIEETFRNESDETLEGVYRFPMPPDARIASLSLEVEGQWEEGAFVAKDRAAAIWRGVIRNATPESQRQQQEEARSRAARVAAGWSLRAAHLPHRRAQRAPRAHRVRADARAARGRAPLRVPARARQRRLDARGPLRGRRAHRWRGRGQDARLRAGA
jgi:hypothetical protein